VTLKKMKQKHKPVLIKEVLRLLNPMPGEAYLDCTAGFGGHASAVLDLIGDSGRAVLVDRDSHAIHALSEAFDGYDNVELRRGNYLNVAFDLEQEERQFDLILLDLGVSSPQLDSSDRGFSFKTHGPIDMRMDQSQPLTGAEVVNRYSEAELVRVIADYGEERRAKSVAKAIVAARPFSTTEQLAKVVRGVVGFTKGIDPATRTFQAIRIEVNDELTSLEQALPILDGLLNPDGRLAVISFHSLEDRIVKRFIDQESRDCICPPKVPVCVCGHTATLVKVTPKAVTPQADEEDNNPRARSAKLRVASKINKNKRRSG
jgi:16S rRNA (cytosine1402-N4)-methyltransferase